MPSTGPLGPPRALYELPKRFGFCVDIFAGFVLEVSGCVLVESFRRVDFLLGVDEGARPQWLPVGVRRWPSPPVRLAARSPGITVEEFVASSFILRR